MIRFPLRDVFWLTLVVGMAVGWWVHQRNLQERVHSLSAQLKYARVLGSTTNAEFVEKPLKDAARYFSDVHGVAIKLDKPSLEEVGMSETTGITLLVKGRTLDEALQQALEDRAKVVVTDDGLLIVGVKKPAGTSSTWRPAARNGWEVASHRSEQLEMYLAKNGKRVRWLADGGKEILEVTDNPTK